MNPQSAADQAENLSIAVYVRDPLEMELREAAAQEIERLGWSQRVWKRSTGEICLKESLTIVCKAAPLLLFDTLVWHLEREIGDDLEFYNDDEGRTKEQVLAALRGTS